MQDLSHAISRKVMARSRKHDAKGVRYMATRGKENYEAGKRRRWVDPEWPLEIDSSAKFTFHRIIYMKKKSLTSFCDGKISVFLKVKSFDMELGQSPGANQDHGKSTIKFYTIFTAFFKKGLSLLILQLSF